MKSIGIKDLKNNLSSYLEFVKKGETILIFDRNNPIAEIKKF
ncbi:type II toxin-antitoxin system Phd/YefM family antitoxin, partial [Leptospira bandrabouensis]